MLAERIIYLRERQGWTQAELAERAGLQQGHISAIEAGKRTRLQASTLHKLADALGVSVNELLGADIQPVGEITDEQALAWLARQNAALADLMRAVQQLPEEKRQRLLRHIDQQIDLLLTLTTENVQHGDGRD